MPTHCDIELCCSGGGQDAVEEGTRDMAPTAVRSRFFAYRATSPFLKAGSKHSDCSIPVPLALLAGCGDGFVPSGIGVDVPRVPRGLRRNSRDKNNKSLQQQKQTFASPLNFSHGPSSPSSRPRLTAHVSLLSQFGAPTPGQKYHDGLYVGECTSKFFVSDCLGARPKQWVGRPSIV